MSRSDRRLSRAAGAGRAVPDQAPRAPACAPPDPALNPKCRVDGTTAEAPGQEGWRSEGSTEVDALCPQRLREVLRNSADTAEDTAPRGRLRP